MIKFPSFISGADINTSTLVDPASINNIKTPIENFINFIDGFSASIRTSSVTLTDTDIINSCSAAAGDITLTLPSLAAASTRGAGFWFKKVDATKNQVFITRSGTDTIEDPLFFTNPTSSSLVASTSTTISLRIPGEYVLLYPVGSVWRVFGWENYYISKFRCFLQNINSQNIGHQNHTSLNYGIGTTVTDPFILHSETTNPSRVNIPMSGRYNIQGMINFASTGGNVLRAARIRINGSLDNIEFNLNTSSSSTIVYSVTRFLNLNDYVEFVAWQNSGSGLDINYSNFSVSFIHP